MKKPDQKPDLFLPATLNVMGGLQWRIQERGPGGPAPPYFYTKLTKIFFETRPPPLYLRVWMTAPPLIRRSGSATGFFLNFDVTMDTSHGKFISEKSGHVHHAIKIFPR